MDRTIFIYANQAETSRKIAAECKEKLLHAGLRVTDQLTRDTDLIICIGGDGTFLELIHAYDFPQTPIIGITRIFCRHRSTSSSNTTCTTWITFRWCPRWSVPSGQATRSTR